MTTNPETPYQTLLEYLIDPNKPSHVKSGLTTDPQKLLLLKINVLQLYYENYLQDDNDLVTTLTDPENRTQCEQSFRRWATAQIGVVDVLEPNLAKAVWQPIANYFSDLIKRYNLDQSGEVPTVADMVNAHSVKVAHDVATYIENLIAIKPIVIDHRKSAWFKAAHGFIVSMQKAQHSTIDPTVNRSVQQAAFGYLVQLVTHQFGFLDSLVLHEWKTRVRLVKTVDDILNVLVYTREYFTSPERAIGFIKKRQEVSRYYTELWQRYEPGSITDDNWEKIATQLHDERHQQPQTA